MQQFSMQHEEGSTVFIKKLRGEGRKTAKRFPRRAKDGKGPLRGWRGLEIRQGNEGPRRAPKGYPRRKDGKGPLRRWRGRGSAKVRGEKGFPPSGPRVGKDKRKGKKISTKGHEGRQRATKERLEGREKARSRGVRQGSPRGAKGFPPSGSTKDGKRQKDFHEGDPLRTSREKELSTKGHEERR